MQPLDTGADLRSARAQLNLGQSEMAVMLGIGISTLKRCENALQLGLTIALAAECLLQRDALKRRGPMTAEEKARRKIEDRRAYRRLLAEEKAREGAPAGRLSPAELVARQLDIAAEKKRQLAERGRNPATERAARAVDYKGERRRLGLIRARNRVRGEERAGLALIHAQVRAAGLAVLVAGRNDWDPYHTAIELAERALGADAAMFRSAYLIEARKRIIEDGDPLVTLPLEVEE